MRALALLAVLTGFADLARAQERSYWLGQGSTIVGSCPGSQGEPMKAANQEGGSWVLVTGVVTCRDAGGSYVFEVNFINLTINSRARDRINRDVLNFDWLGLAVYAPKDGGAHVEWLYDEAFPIRVSLRRESTDKVYVGRMAFTVPKTAIQRASNFVFYTTAEGVLIKFGLM